MTWKEYHFLMNYKYQVAISYWMAVAENENIRKISAETVIRILHDFRRLAILMSWSINSSMIVIHLFSIPLVYICSHIILLVIINLGGKYTHSLHKPLYHFRFSLPNNLVAVNFVWKHKTHSSFDVKVDDGNHKYTMVAYVVRLWNSF